MEAETTLKEWVREHHVTWELGPWQELVEHVPVAVGFELRLFGQHEPQVHASPGCTECGALHDKLRAMALAAFPKQHRPTQYEIEPFHSSLHLRPESEWTPEVQLTVHIVHREGYLRPVDECEKLCAAEIQEAFRDLGIQPKTWKDTRRGVLPES